MYNSTVFFPSELASQQVSHKLLMNGEICAQAQK